MTIMQGDQYPISFALKDKAGNILTPTQIADIECIIGSYVYQYTDGNITYSDGKYQVMLTQQVTSALPVGATYQQIRVKFAGANERVKGVRLDNIEVIHSRSKAVL